MAKAQKLVPASFLTGILLIAFPMMAPGQVPSVPPAQSQPPAPPTGTGQAPPDSRMVPTGLAENGGSFAYGVYTNTIYDFSLKTPPGWVVVPAHAASGAKLQGVDPELMKYSESNRMLLIMTENAPFKKAYQRRSIQISATRLASPETQSAEGYLTYSQKTAKEKAMAVEYLNAPKGVTINGQKLWWNKMKMNTAGGPQVANQYVVMRGPYLLQFFLVGPDEEGLKSLQPTIQSLDIKPMLKEKTTAPAKPVTTHKKTAKPAAPQAAPSKPTQ